MAGVPQAGAHLWTQDDSLYTPVFPFIHPPALFPHWLGTPGSQSYQLTFVDSCVIWCSHPVVSKMSRCSSCIDMVIVSEVFVKQRAPGGMMPGFRCLFRASSAYHALFSGLISCRIFLQCVWQNIHIYTYILSVHSWEKFVWRISDVNYQRSSPS